jgi:hypothetical protein
MFTSVYPVSLVSVPHFDVDLAIQNYIDFNVYLLRPESSIMGSSIISRRVSQ